MKYNLFLDDVRDPKDAFLYFSSKVSPNGLTLGSMASLEKASGISDDDWVVVRSHDEFCQAINERGIPSSVSFDHDLNFSHMRHYFEVSRNGGDKLDYSQIKETGYHCALFLKEKLDKTGKTSLIYCHSANHIGRENIREVFTT